MHTKFYAIILSVPTINKTLNVCFIEIFIRIKPMPFNFLEREESQSYYRILL